MRMTANSFSTARMTALVLGAALISSTPVLAQEGPLALALSDLERHDVKNWAYTQKLNITAMEEEAVEVITRHDPSKPEGEQVTLISITPADEENKSHSVDEHGDKDIPNYADLGELVEEGVELIREDDQVAVYRVKPNKDGHSFKFGNIDVETDDIGEDLKGELTVVKGEKPYVSDVKFFIDAPHGSVWLAKVKQLDFGFTFAPEGPDETMLARSFKMDMDMTTLVFINIAIDLDMAFSDFVYVGEAE